MRREAIRRSLLTRSKESSWFLFSSDLRSEHVEMCQRRAYCAVMQHYRCSRRNRQDAANNEKEFPGKMEGGKGVDGERKGQGRPFRNVIILFVLFGSPSVFWAEKEFENFHHKNQDVDQWSI